MPWSNQGGGPWGSGGGGSKGPWGGGPQSSGPTPPDLEELLRRSQDKLRSVLPGGGLGAGEPAFQRVQTCYQRCHALRRLLGGGQLRLGGLGPRRQRVLHQIGRAHV